MAMMATEALKLLMLLMPLISVAKLIWDYFTNDENSQREKDYSTRLKEQAETIEAQKQQTLKLEEALKKIGESQSPNSEEL